MKRTLIVATIVLITAIMGGDAMALELTSPAFTNGAPIPAQYTCDGANISPAFTWSGAPKKTKSFALIADDPDAPMGVWVHWVIWNIPATATGLAEKIAPTEKLPDESEQGLNDSRKYGYSGPCPPGGKHRYYFKLYALDRLLALPKKANKGMLKHAMKDRILAQTEMMGTYRRKR